GFREPLQYWLLSGEDKHREATYRNYATVMGLYGQFPGGGFAGDENSRPGYGDPRQGFETCGIVELMHSCELLTRFTGDIAWTDRCEELAFNSLPASYDPKQQVMHYITCANSVQLDDRPKHGQFQNAFPMGSYLYGVHQYRCCPHNYGMGWPYYVQELWLATTDNGLAASMYAASKVTATVGSGETVTVVQETDYPFSDRLQFTVNAERPVRFPFYLRRPGWAVDASVKVNGEHVDVAGDWMKVERTWHSGDRVELTLPMRTTTRVWSDNHDSVSVDRGPLTYSLKIDERYERIGGTEEWPELSVYPESPWNYGLVAGASFDLVQRSGGEDPFTADGVPLALTTQAQRIPQWETDVEDVVGLLQQSPARSVEPVETVTLIPMGAARLRVTSFPQVSASGSEWAYRTRITASHVNYGDSLEAPASGRTPESSADRSIPRFTWWDREGTTEWIEYDLRSVRDLSSVSAYWFDDTGFGQCRVPESWRVLWLDRETWRPVENTTPYDVDLDKLNTTTFTPVQAQHVRVEAVLRPAHSGGLLLLTFA
ncbi:MAG: transcriptional initiation protein Tat, partial [Kribbellaceae bacterium]|nr:transcriptional initiation protein Tat [Kribbellaceae bacterium]